MSPFTRLARSTRRSRLVTLPLVAAALLIPVGAAQAVSTSATRHADATPKPTIVLVHGAWADASSFAPVTEALQHDGYTVLAAPNPLRSVQSDSDSLTAFLKGLTTGPVVLVGHSYGGTVITNAALSDPDVKGLVYIDAFAPEVGESSLGILTAAGAGDPSGLFNTVSYPGAAGGDVDLYLKPDVVPSALANGLPSDVQQLVAASQRPVTFSALTEDTTAAAWKTLPSWYVVGTQDHIIPPALQTSMATRAGASITTVDTGHLAMLGAPKAVTQVIEQAARAAR